MKFRKAIGTAALVVLATVAVYAWTGTVGMDGSESSGLQAWASLHSSWSEGAPWVELRVDGYSGSCTNGVPYNGGCGGAAINDFIGGWNAPASIQVNIIPCGTYSASAKYYVADSYVGTRYAGQTFVCSGGGTDGCTAESGGGMGCDPGGTSPIVIATGRSRAYRLTSTADGVVFDLNADGAKEQTAWTEAGSEIAFLARDLNGNGEIDSGAELFGDHTLAGASNGFEALIRLVGVGISEVNGKNPLFTSLLLWTDRNHNGISEADELQPASDVLEAIGLGYNKSPRRDGNGNTYPAEGWARRVGAARAEAREFKIYDVVLR